MKHEHNLPSQSLSSIRPGSGFCFERGGWAYVKSGKKSYTHATALKLSSGKLTDFSLDMRVFPLDIEAHSNP